MYCREQIRMVSNMATRVMAAGRRGNGAKTRKIALFMHPRTGVVNETEWDCKPRGLSE